MPAPFKTYRVISFLPVVVNDGGVSVSYEHGATFVASANNFSVQNLLEEGKVAEVPSGTTSSGVLVIQGPPGPQGPPGATGGLPAVLAVDNTTGANDIEIDTGQKVLGAAALTLDGTTVLNLQTGATTRWQVTAAGHLVPGVTDNVEDIGGAGTNRIRTLYAGTSVVVGSTVTIATASVTGSGALTVQATAAALGLVATGAFGISMTTNGLARSRVSGDGAQEWVGLATVSAPAVSAAGEARLYYDTTLDQVMLSKNGAAYANLAGGGASSLAATLAVGNTTGANNITVATGQQVEGAVELTLNALTDALHLIGATGINVGTTFDTAQVNIGRGYLGSPAIISTLTSVEFTTNVDLGFFGATPAPQPTIGGSTAGNSALGSFITELETLGLVVDGTTDYVVAHTGNGNLAAEDTGTLRTNRGAAGAVTLTLPPVAGLLIGTNYTFRRLASFAFRVDPQATEHLRYSSGAMANGEYLEMASDEATMRVTWDGTEWLVDLENGTLAEETP